MLVVTSIRTRSARKRPTVAARTSGSKMANEANKKASIAEQTALTIEADAASASTADFLLAQKMRRRASDLRSLGRIRVRILPNIQTQRPWAASENNKG